MSICTIADCDGVVVARGWCRSHYSRWYRHGEIAEDPIRGQVPIGLCIVDECHRQAAHSSGWCWTHYMRWYRYGDADTVNAKASGARNGWWKGDDIGYTGAHDRLRRARGRVQERTCSRCDKPAQQWSYDRLDPDEKKVGGCE